ncbi:MAG: cytochrome c [Bacteroidales bacterium]|nr:cytochrome c [Bacteroidales bacterium]
MNQKIVLTRQILVAVILAFSATAFVSCEKYVYDPPKIDLTTPISFQNEIAPIFKSNCFSCHKSGGLNFTDATTTWTSINTAKFLTSGNPESSLIYTKLTTGSHETRCSIEDRNTIYAWIKQGATNDIGTK